MAVGLLAGLASCSHSGGGALRWIDQPPKGRNASAAVVTIAPPTARPCQTNDFVVAFGGGYGQGGRGETTFDLANRSASTCSVSGYPAVTAVTSAGPVLSEPATYVFDPSFPDPGQGGNVAPGSVAMISITTYTQCPNALATEPGDERSGADQASTSLAVHLPDGDLQLPTQVSALCGLRVLRWDVAGPGPLMLLRPTVALPKTVRAGSTLRYVVRLASTSAAPLDIPRDACPSYREQIVHADRAPMTDERFALNCGTGNHLPPGGNITFAMEAHIPSNATPGVYRLTWSFGDATPFNDDERSASIEVLKAG